MSLSTNPDPSPDRSLDQSAVPAWPAIRALTRADGSGVVTINGTSHPVTATNLADTREQIRLMVRDTAAQLGRPVRLSTSGIDGEWALVVNPDGTVNADSTQPPSRRAPRPGRTRRPSTPPIPAASPAPAATPATATAATVLAAPADGAAAVLRVPRPAADVLRDPVTQLPDHAEVAEDAEVHHDDGGAAGEHALEAPGAPAVTAPTSPTSPDAWLHSEPSSFPPGRSAAPDGDGAPQTRREARRSFLTEDRSEEPATRGVRGLLTRAGIRIGPSEAERTERADARAVSQHWPGPRTVAVVNGKGGAGKTPTTVLLAAVFARHGGAGVLGWDNNQTRGTLGWRTEQGPHEATLLDLLPQVDRLLGTGAQSADLARYVHHQTRDRFDVLRSKPMALADEQRVSPDDVDAIHAVAAKYYRLIFLDSGNDESDPMWLRMIDHTDQLVVATTTRDDHAEAGALLLEALAGRDEHSAALAANAVAVVTQAEPRATSAAVQRVVDGYRPLTRAAVRIPFDPAIVDGVLRYGSLRPTTQRAWLAAAAAVAGGL
ncbi:ATPase [Aquipuribacter hungaricus]|uniref:ATPase n=1 Tax=Aquipuribacter hungaricus TaxID=545624 RepID=A0ABV7WKP1_9MICO